jgi:hypothetical protein
MFVRKLTLKREDKQYSYLRVVENSWQQGKAVQRTLVNLGNVDGWPQEKLEQLVVALTGFLEMDMVALSSVRFNQCRMLGPYLALSGLWEWLGLDEILAHAFGPRKMDPRAIACAKAMVLSRLVEPRSKRAVSELVSHYIAIPGVDGNDLPLSCYYRTLEYLSQEKTKIEKAVHAKLVNLFNQDVSLVFYDLTSAYFEGRQCAMAKRGYSREHRPDLVQIEIGLLVDAEGLPIGHEVFDGSVKDVRTVIGTLKRLQDDFGVRRCIFIGDDGMASEANLNEVASRGYEYITSLSLGRSPIGAKLLGEAPQPRHWSQLGENLCLEPLGELDGVRYIGTYNPQGAAATREHRKARLRHCMDSLRKLLTPVKLHGRKKGPEELFVRADRLLVGKVCHEMILLERTESGFSWKLSREAFRKASRLDGVMIIKTNSKTLSDEEVARGYRTLWRVEDAFRHIKDGIGLRPTRHWNDSRVLGHVFVCVLAYTIERLYERELAGANLEVSASAALDELRSVIVATLQAGHKSVRRRSEITPRQRQLLAAAGVTEVPQLW